MPVINAPAPAGALRRKIGRTENIRTAVQIRHDLLLAEHMVAERDHVRAGGKNIIRLTRENAVAGRIFAVYDDEIRAGVALDAAEKAVKRVDTRLTDHIANSFMDYLFLSLLQAVDWFRWIQRGFACPEGAPYPRRGARG